MPIYLYMSIVLIEIKEYEFFLKQKDIYIYYHVFFLLSFKSAGGTANNFKYYHDLFVHFSLYITL